MLSSLPPALEELLPETHRKVEDATFLLGQVKMCRRLLPYENLLIYSSLQREALASSEQEHFAAEATHRGWKRVDASPQVLVLVFGQQSKLP